MFKFKAGQAVFARKSLNHGAPAGRYRIITALPRSSGPVEYRVKSMSEAFERVVREVDLTECTD